MKWKPLVAVVGLVAVSLAAGGYGYAALTSTSNVYTGCLYRGEIRNIKIGTKPTSACVKGTMQVSWNQQGQPGADGTSVTSTALSPGDTNCPDGGSSFSSASGVTYACNGVSGITRWNETSGVRDVRSKNGFGPDLSDMTDRTGIVLLASIGTFKIDGICWHDDNNTYAATFLETTEDGAVPAAYGHLLNVSDGPLELSGSASDYSLQSSVVGGGFLAANAARSLFIQGSYDQAVYPLQPSDSVRTCRFAGFVVRSP